jgi:hypothetical protein
MLRRRRRRPSTAARRSETLAERVVEQDAPALLGEEPRQMAPRARASRSSLTIAGERVSALTGKTTGSFTSVESWFFA